jgi:hypothetical protein
VDKTIHNVPSWDIQTNVQLILRDGKPEWAILPYEHYQQMIEEIEMLEDIRDYDAAKQRIEDGEELVPGELTFAVLKHKMVSLQPGDFQSYHPWTVSIKIYLCIDDGSLLV